jgi:hypothetical protein
MDAGFTTAVVGASNTLQWNDMSNWDREPIPELNWIIRDRVPIKQAGLFSGEGGAGKSLIQLTKDVAHAIGKDWPWWPLGVLRLRRRT